jgi:hypothetical protein
LVNFCISQQEQVKVCEIAQFYKKRCFYSKGKQGYAKSIESNHFAARQGQLPNHPNPAAIRPKNPFFRLLRGHTCAAAASLQVCGQAGGWVGTVKSPESSGNAPQKPIFPPAARGRTRAAAASMQVCGQLLGNRLPDCSNPAAMRPKNPFFRPLRSAVPRAGPPRTM